MIWTLIIGLIVAAMPLVAQSQFSKAGAMAVMQTKDWNRVLAYCQAWARAEPNNADAWFCVGRTYGSKVYNIGLGDPAQAVPAYQRSVQLNPGAAETWHALGLTYQELGQWPNSVTALEHALQIAPQRTNSLQFLCGSYMHTHQFQQAAAVAANIERYARTSEDWFQAGACYYAVAPYYQPAAMYLKSKQADLRVAQMEPQNGAAWTNLGASEQALGNTDAAFADYERGARLGNQQGATNDANLRADIQACMIQRNSIMTRVGIIYGGEVSTYNTKCTQYTGRINLIIRP